MKNIGLIILQRHADMHTHAHTVLFVTKQNSLVLSILNDSGSCWGIFGISDFSFRSIQIIIGELETLVDLQSIVWIQFTSIRIKFHFFSMLIGIIVSIVLCMRACITHGE